MGDVNTDNLWVSALEAVHLLSPEVGGDKIAKERIADRLKDGALKANVLWMAGGVDLGSLLRQRTSPELSLKEAALRALPENFDYYKRERTVPEISETKFGAGLADFVTPHRSKRASLGRAFWSFADTETWDRDQKRWNWSEGLFVVSQEPIFKVAPQGTPLKYKFGRRLFVYGLELRRSEVLALIPRKSPEASILPVTPPSVKRRAQKYDWEELMTELVAFAYHKPLRDQFDIYEMKGFQTKLEKWLTERLEAKGLNPGPSAIRNKAVAIREAIGVESHRDN